MNSLVSLFDSIDISSVGCLSADDIKFLESAIDKYLAYQEYVKNLKLILSDIEPQIDKLNSFAKDKCILKYSFTTKEVITETINHNETLRANLTTEIKNYFQKKYFLNDFHTACKLSFTTDKDTMIQSILDYCDGYPITEMSLVKEIKKFHDTLPNRAERIKIGNDTISLKQFSILSSLSSGKFYLQSYNDRMRMLISIIHHFEFNSFDFKREDYPFWFSGETLTDEHYQSIIPLPNIKKITGIKLFKNESVNIKFTSPELLNAFVSKYKIDSYLLECK